VKPFLALAAVAGLASLVPVSQAAPSAEARVLFTEVCRFEPLSDRGVALTTDFTLRSVGELPAVATVTPGWNVARLYPKARGSRTFRLRVGQTVKFSVTRRLPHAPALRAALKPPARLHCESKVAIRVAKS
jgi:hypothetical protein